MYPKPMPKPKFKAKANPPSKPPLPPLGNRGRDPYGNVPGVEDTRYVPWAEDGNGVSVSQLKVLGNCCPRTMGEGETPNLCL